MNTYNFAQLTADSADLKCLLINKGVRVETEVYDRWEGRVRLNRNPLWCNSFLLSDSTNIYLTDMGERGDTPFRIALLPDGMAALFHENDYLDTLGFHPPTDFYTQHTAQGLPFAANAVLQSCDFVSFPCLWACEYALAGKPCAFCYSGAEQASLARQGMGAPAPVSPADLADIVRYALQGGDACSVQLTGGSTFNGRTEHEHLVAYLQALGSCGLPPDSELLLYITPPVDLSFIDDYFALGATKVACSIEVWNEAIAAQLTPGKMQLTTRARHLRALEYVSEKFGVGKAFSNFIIGLEDVDSLREGATYLAERGIIPSASVWMPYAKGRDLRCPAVVGSDVAEALDYFRRVKEMLAELYNRYQLVPPGRCGLNVCAERDIYRWGRSKKAREKLGYNI